MRTFPDVFKKGIAQHTTRGEDRPLLSPIGGRGEEGFWRRWGGRAKGERGKGDDLSLGWWWFRKKSVCGGNWQGKKAD